MRHSVKALALVLAVSAAAPSFATVINFDDGSYGTSVGNFYASSGVTFNNATFTNNFGLTGSSGTLGINSSAGGYQFGADNPIIATFSSAVSSVGIRGIDSGFAGIRLEAYDANDALIGFDEFYGSNVGIGEYHDLLFSGTGIASVRLFQPATSNGGNPYGDGVLFDNFSFDTSAVPEPASWAMMLAGFGLLGGALRRNRVAVRFA